jgi:hypothetical protein
MVSLTSPSALKLIQIGGFDNEESDIAYVIEVRD